MEEASSSAMLKASGNVGRDGASGRTSVGKAYSVVRSPNTHIRAVAAMSVQEDCLYTATADPAFWLKEVSC
jgi:hypothetical protein